MEPYGLKYSTRFSHNMKKGEMKEGTFDKYGLLSYIRDKMMSWLRFLCSYETEFFCW